MEVIRIRSNHARGMRKVKALLESQDLSLDTNLDYTCGIFDQDMNLIATGSAYSNTLRCLAVEKAYQGEGLLNKIITHLIEVQIERGNRHFFLYAKSQSAKFFADLGFYEIARVKDQLVFMENIQEGFQSYLNQLIKPPTAGKHGAIVMNANPFTLGHLHLIEYAASRCDWLHLFLVSQDASLIPYKVRRHLLEKGITHLNNVLIQETSHYLISHATFPSYFLRDEAAVIQAQARLDVEIFKRIASYLTISERFVGEEPYSLVTNLYNQTMAETLPASGMDFTMIPRKEDKGQAISASHVRQLIKDGRLEAIVPLVPRSTSDYLMSEDAQELITKIQMSDEVKHY